MNDEQNGRIAADVYARTMTDPEFKAQFIADPAAVLSAAGVEVPEGLTIKVLENSSTTVHVILPDPEAMTDELLAAASGGSTAGSASTASTLGCSCGPSTTSSAGSAGSAGCK
jgi:hypothetical protein